MVQHDVVRAGFGSSEAADLNAVASRSDIAPAADAELANDDVVDAVVVAGDNSLNRDASAGSRLTGDRDVRLGNANVAANDPADLENDDPWPVGGAGFRQAARTGGVEIGH